MATKEITVKSGVAGLSVTPTLVKAGSDLMVTATGKAGGGTVQGNGFRTACRLAPPSRSIRLSNRKTAM